MQVGFYVLVMLLKSSGQFKNMLGQHIGLNRLKFERISNVFQKCINQVCVKRRVPVQYFSTERSVLFCRFVNIKNLPGSILNTSFITFSDLIVPFIINTFSDHKTWT